MMKVSARRIGLRVTQVLCGAIAFGTAIIGHTNMCPFGKNLFDSDLQVNFLIANGALVTTCVTAWSVVFEVKHFQFMASFLITGLFDAIWAIFALAGGTAAASSNLVRNVCTREALRLGVETTCDLKCSFVQVSVVATFFIFFFSTASMAMSLYMAAATSKLTELKA